MMRFGIDMLYESGETWCIAFEHEVEAGRVVPERSRREQASEVGGGQ